MTFREVIDQLDVWENWRESYNKYVPLFIEEARKGENWKTWNENVFYEFFSKGGDQYVASLQQGYFTNHEKQLIKDNWDKIAPLLKQIADNQDEPQYGLYNQLKKTLRSYTSLDRRAATNRMIASLQPKLLCTVVNEKSLYQLFIHLSLNIEEKIPDYFGGDWFRNSHNIWKFYQEQLNDKDYTEIITLPWETLDYFKGGHHLQKSNDMSEDTTFEEAINVLKSKNQIIFQGAPGTGKTYTAKDIAEKLIYGNFSSDKKQQAERLKTSDQFKLIQFHPAYTYEDFVRGIVIKTENGHPEYITQNKILGEFAARALKNIDDSKKSKSKLAEEKSFENKLDEYKEKIRDIIAREKEYPIGETTARIMDVLDESFKFYYEGNKVIIFTLLFSDLIKMHNSGLTFTRVKDVSDFELTMKGKGSYYFPLYNEIINQEVKEITPPEEVPEKDYILIIDEINRANLPAVLGELIYALEYRGQKVDSMYSVDGDKGLILPPNLYIIGTMNTADRSVGQIDYAIRRRFAFIDMLPKKLDVAGFDEELFQKVSELFIKSYEEYISSGKIESADCLSEEFRPEDVWIGHSYFIMQDKDGKNIKEMRIKYEIVPILKEYLKDGIFNDKKDVNRVISELLTAVQE